MLLASSMMRIYQCCDDSLASMSTTKIRRKVIAYGLVQGVFFRDTCRREARRRNVSGWVRNRSDGAVEAVVEGSVDDVEAMIAWMHDGPPSARVDHVEVFEENVEGIAGFDVRHFGFGRP
jgi:acylphosphatase